MNLRPARAADIPRMKAIEIAAAELFRGVGLIDLDDMETADDNAYLAAIGAGLSFVVECDGETAGFAIGEWRGSAAHLLEIDVDPRWQRKGVGARLLEAFCAEAAARGADTAWLSTFRDPPWNAPFYRRYGFSDVAPADYPPWVRKVETDQARWLDVSKRVFMKRTVTAQPA